MLCIFFFEFLSICYLCAKSHLNNEYPAVPPMPWMFPIMKCWQYIVTGVLLIKEHVRPPAAKHAFWNCSQHLAGSSRLDTQACDFAMPSSIAINTARQPPLAPPIVAFSAVATASLCLSIYHPLTGLCVQAPRTCVPESGFLQRGHLPSDGSQDKSSESTETIRPQQVGILEGPMPELEGIPIDCRGVFLGYSCHGMQ